MTRAQRMRKLGEIEEHRAQNSARRLGAVQARVDAGEKTLRQLERYRSEYTAAEHSRSASCGQRLLDTRAFIARLEEAIAQQARNNAQVREELDAARMAWIADRARSRSLETVADNLQAEEQRRLDLHEQRALDDMSASAPARGKSPY